MNWIDAHAHHQENADPVMILKQAFAAAIEPIALGGTHPPDWNKQRELDSQFPGKLILNFGLHPWWVEQYSRAELEAILEQLDRELPRVHGLGETGLDFYPDKRDPLRFEDQRFMFREQLRLAIRHQKPVILHGVHAHDELLKILKEEGASRVPLVIHRFSGNLDQLQDYLQIGARISFHESKKLMKAVPLNRILLETDSHMQRHPGGWDIRPHYEKSAEIMGLPVDELREKVAENFREIGYSLGP